MGVRLLLLDNDAGSWPDAALPADAGQQPLAGRAGAAAVEDSGAGGTDAGLPYKAPDAAIMDAAAADAGTTLDAGALPSCGGERVFGLCWYLSADDTSCNTECATKGGFDARALNYVGVPNQGGSQAECSAILRALGLPGTVSIGTQRIGLGCHRWSDGALWWIQSPAFSPTVAAPSGTNVRVACACQR